MATIQIPDELYQRLLSLGCASEAFYISALEEALARRRTVDEPKSKAKPGPKATVAKATLGVYIETDLIDWLKAQMRGPSDLGAVVSSILRQAKDNNFKAFPDG